MAIESDNPFEQPIGPMILARLRDEEIIWLTTVDANWMPQPRPVWFHWDGENVLILSQKQAAKVRHIERSSKVSLNFNTTPDGGDVGVILGEARVSIAPVDSERLKEYVQKYRIGIENLGMSIEQMLGEYPIWILVYPLRVRGFQ